MSADNCVECDPGFNLEGGKCTAASLGLAEIVVRTVIGFLRWYGWF